jgi:hypothetical protein
MPGPLGGDDVIVQGHDETPGHRRWDWIYYVAAGIAIASPAGSLPFKFPIDYAIAIFAAIVVCFRGIWWGWRTGRSFLALGAIGIVLNGTVIYQWFDYYQYLHRSRTREERSHEQEKLHAIVRALEYAKLVHGDYPEALSDLEDWLPSLYFADIWDPTTPPGCRPIHPGYRRLPDGTGYELFGVGLDCATGTADDVVLTLTPRELTLVGLRNPR